MFHMSEGFGSRLFSKYVFIVGNFCVYMGETHELIFLQYETIFSMPILYLQPWNYNLIFYSGPFFAFVLAMIETSYDINFGRRNIYLCVTFSPWGGFCWILFIVNTKFSQMVSMVTKDISCCCCVTSYTFFIM